jgi:glutaconate CoA-transferase subunit A
MFTKLATAGQVRVIEETEASLACGLRATLAGVSFMPGLGWIGTDMLRARPDVKLIDDPYGDGAGVKQYVAFPAIPCDVAVIHALRSDWRGNAHIGGNMCIDSELALAASRVVVTAEEVVERIEKPIEVPCVRVAAVVHAPRGAWPTSCHPFYPVDGKEIMRYSESCPNGFADYLETFLSTPSPRKRFPTPPR